jgi:hypothetical protein
MARPKGTKYMSVDEFFEIWNEYVASVGYDQIEQVTSRGEIVTLNVKKPLLRSGFEAYVYRKKGFGISHYIDNQDGAYEDYLGVITCMRKEWETDQVSGTMTGRYKAPNLTARLNGISDKQEIKHDITSFEFGND